MQIVYFENMILITIARIIIHTLSNLKPNKMKSISGKNIQTSLCSLDHSIFLHLPNSSVQSPQVLRRHLVLL